MSGTSDDNLSGTRTGDWTTTSGAAACSSVDTAPPVLTAPSEVVADATTPAGANVAFAATATDVVDGQVPVTCSPPSGSFFLIGDAQVECTATDTAGNTAEASFNLHVNGAAEQLGNLMVDLADLSPPATPQIKVGLNFMLKRAQQSLAVKDTRAACANLGSFVRSVYDALMPPAPKLSPPEGQALVAAARRIRAVIGC